MNPTRPGRSDYSRLWDNSLKFVWFCLQTQIQAKQQRQAAEVDQNRQEAEQSKLADQQYRARVEATLSGAEPQSYFGRRKVDWMF